MTSAAERAFCEWCTRYAFPNGTIVELGPWLGSLTRALLDGIRPGANPQIHSYDRFEWEAYMAEWVAAADSRGLSPGDSFRALYERQLGPVGRVHIHGGDLSAERWDGGTIDVLIVDAMKSWELARGIVDGFYGSLHRGSLLMHQDYADPWCPWIHLISYRQRSSLRKFADLRNSGGLVFKVAAPLPTDPALTDPSSYSDGEVDAAFEWSLALARRDKHPGIRLAKVVFYALRKQSADLKRAHALLAELGDAKHGDRWRVEEFVRSGHYLVGVA